jgi:hypothetical protein
MRPSAGLPPDRALAFQGLRRPGRQLRRQDVGCLRAAPAGIRRAFEDRRGGRIESWFLLPSIVGLRRLRLYRMRRDSVDHRIRYRTCRRTGCASRRCCRYRCRLCIGQLRDDCTSPVIGSAIEYFCTFDCLRSLAREGTFPLARLQNRAVNFENQICHFDRFINDVRLFMTLTLLMLAVSANCSYEYFFAERRRESRSNDARPGRRHDHRWDNRPCHRGEGWRLAREPAIRGVTLRLQRGRCSEWQAAAVPGEGLPGVLGHQAVENRQQSRCGLIG